MNYVTNKSINIPYILQGNYAQIEMNMTYIYANLLMER